MNKLQGRISVVRSIEHMSQVEVDIAGARFTTVILETAETLSYLKVGSPVKIIFKETEVILSSRSLASTTLSNQIPGVIKGMEVGELLTRIEVESMAGKVNAVVTSHSLRSMKIDLGETVYLYVNPNELMLAQ